MVPLVDTANPTTFSGDITNLDQMVLEWVTLWNNSKVEDYGYPRPEPLSIEISDHLIEV